MASIKVRFRPVVESGEGFIEYSVMHGRQTRVLPTTYKLKSSEWNEQRSSIRTATTPDDAKRLADLRKNVSLDVMRMSRIIRHHDDQGFAYSVDDLIDKFISYARDCTLFKYMQLTINRLKENGKLRTAETYVSAMNSFRNFHRNQDIILDSLTSETIRNYETFLIRKGLTPNSTSFYMRILRAVYNRAVNDGIIEQRWPFKQVYTGIDRTVKRALPLRMIKKIMALDLSCNPGVSYARDIFMLSFYLRGMSYIDMAHLTKNDMQNGYITYRRHKTGQLLSIKWTDEMQLIIDKYKSAHNEYLLPILNNPRTGDRNVYRNAASTINRNLKKLGRLAGITTPLTLYCARHSWASVAKAKGVPISVISECMGHDSESTTRIYLATLNTSAVDKANLIVIRSLTSGIKKKLSSRS